MESDAHQRYLVGRRWCHFGPSNEDGCIGWVVSVL
jgi:hypothetical protein